MAKITGVLVFTPLPQDYQRLLDLLQTNNFEFQDVVNLYGVGGVRPHPSVTTLQVKDELSEAVKAQAVVYMREK